LGISWERFGKNLGGTMELRLEANKAYHEIEIFDGKTKIGEAEIEVVENMLSRLLIYEPYRNKGYGTRAVKMLIEDYGCTCLWVEADNSRAIHVYEKCGFKKAKETMFLMELTTMRDNG
jgi:RimJ/RimL family protein N-acetyltransferase